MPRKGVPVLVRVKLHEQADLAQIIQARDPFAFGLGARQGRQKQPGEYGNDRDHDQQFDQGETRPALSARRTRRTSQIVIAVHKRSPGLRKSSGRQSVHRLRDPRSRLIPRGVAGFWQPSRARTGWSPSVEALRGPLHSHFRFFG